METKRALIITVLYIIIQFTETSSWQTKDENLSTHLNTISKALFNLEERQNGPSFGDMTATAIKKVKSLLVEIIDYPSTPSNQRNLMLETIKDLQKMEDFIGVKEPVIREVEDYCETLIKNNIFKKGFKKVNDVSVVLKYIDELNAPAETDKNKLKKDVDSIIVVLAVKARHMPEMEKLIDYLEARKNVINGVLDMDRYIETLGFTIREMQKLQNTTQRFAPLIDHLLEQQEDIKQMNLIYSSLIGKNLIENGEDAKRISFMIKFKIISAIKQLQYKSTIWSKFVEEWEHLSNL